MGLWILGRCVHESVCPWVGWLVGKWSVVGWSVDLIKLHSMTRPSWCRHDIQVLQSLFSITVCNHDRQKKRKKKKYLKQKQLLTWNDLTFSITLKGLSYCKTKRNIAGITFKRLYDTKPCFTDQSIFEYTDHLFLCCDMKLYSQNFFTNANC